MIFEWFLCYRYDLGLFVGLVCIGYHFLLLPPRCYLMTLSEIVCFLVYVLFYSNVHAFFYY